MTIKLYHAPYSRSVRVRWLLEEMELPYELETIDFKMGDAGGEDYKAVFPLQKVPAVEIDGRVMCESTAIIEYIAATRGPTPLAPDAADPEYGPYLQWLHFGEAGMGVYVSLLMGHERLLPEERRIPAMARWAGEQVAKQLDYISEGLGDKEFLLGRGFSVADISVGYMLLLLKLVKRMADAPENVQEYFHRLAERPAWQRATAR